MKQAAAPYQIHLLGDVILRDKAHPGARVVVREGYQPALLFSLARPSDGCPFPWDPIAEMGHLSLTAMGPDDATVQEWAIPLACPPLVVFDEGYKVYRRLPSLQTDDGPWRVPPTPGVWCFNLRWRAWGREQQQRLSFEVCPEPTTTAQVAALWAQHGPLLTDEGGSWEAFAAAIKEHEESDQLWVLVGHAVSQLEMAGRWAELEVLGLRLHSLAKGLSLASERIRGASVIHFAARNLGALDRADTWLSEVEAELEALDFHNRRPLESYNRAILERMKGRLLAAQVAAHQASNDAVRIGNELFARGATNVEAEILQLLGHASLLAHALVHDLKGLSEGCPASTSPQEIPLYSGYAWLCYLLLSGGGVSGAAREELRLRCQRASDHAMQALKAHGFRTAITLETLNQASYASERGDSHQAHHALAQLAKHTKISDLPTPEAQQHHTALGRMASLEGCVDAALAHFIAAEDLGERPGGAPIQAGTAAFEAGRAYMQRGDTQAALAAFERAIKWSQMWVDTLGSPFHRADLARAQWGWHSAALSLHLDITPEGALKRLEILRSQRLAVLTRGRDEDEMSVTERAQLNTLEQKIRASEKAAVALRDNADSRTRLAREVSLLHLIEEREVLFGTPTEAPILPPFSTPTPLPDTTIIAAEALSEELVVWQYHSGAPPSCQRVAISRFEVATLVKRFARSVQQGKPHREYGEVLASHLLGRSPKQLGATIQIVVDGLLAQLPWAALPLDGAPLAARSRLVFGLSACAPCQHPPRAHKRPLVVASPDETLPHARRQGTSLAEQLGGVAFLGNDPPVDRLRLTGALSGADLFHFEGHANLLDRVPMASYLRLSQGWRLSLFDLRGMHLPGRPTVILNACEAGRLPDDGGGIACLSYAFIAAGATQVLAPLWEIDDALGAAFADALYQIWSPTTGEVGLAAALSQTVRASLRGDLGPDLAHSGVWAAYQLVGAPRAGQHSQSSAQLTRHP